MSFECCFEMAGPDVVAEDFNGEIVILNLTKGKYYSLTGLAVDFWNNIVDGKQPRQLLDHLDDAGYEHTDEARIFIEALVEEELIRPLPEGLKPASVASEIQLTFGSETEPPSLAAFDDMAELILADPIHDTEEEVGWPVKRASD